MPVLLLLTLSNIFMTIAWYWHLRGGATSKPLLLVILISWGFALIEYCFAVPANRLGYVGGWSVGQLKITQEAIAIDLGWALQFDRLGIPERLDQLENVLKQGRIADPKSMVEVLGLIDRDEHIVNYARAHARELSERISSSK